MGTDGVRRTGLNDGHRGGFRWTTVTALFLGILGCGAAAPAETSLFAKWGIAPSYRTEFKAGEADRE